MQNLTKQQKIDRLASLPKDAPDLLNIMELSIAMHAPYSYVRNMKLSGFPMPGGRNTIGAAHQWLADNPDWKGKPDNKIRYVPPGQTSAPTTTQGHYKTIDWVSVAANHQSPLSQISNIL